MASNKASYERAAAEAERYRLEKQRRNMADRVARRAARSNQVKQAREFKRSAAEGLARRGIPSNAPMRRVPVGQSPGPAARALRRVPVGKIPLNVIAKGLRPFSRVLGPLGNASSFIFPDPVADGRLPRDTPENAPGMWDARWSRRKLPKNKYPRPFEQFNEPPRKAKPGHFWGIVGFRLEDEMVHYPYYHAMVTISMQLAPNQDRYPPARRPVVVFSGNEVSSFAGEMRLGPYRAGQFGSYQASTVRIVQIPWEGPVQEPFYPEGDEEFYFPEDEWIIFDPPPIPELSEPEYDDGCDRNPEGCVACRFETATMQRLVAEAKRQIIEDNTERIGAKQPDGKGVVGLLKKVQASQKVQQALGALNLITVLHNAAMLTTSLAQTLGDVTSQGLTAIGRMVGWVGDGDSLDVNQIVGGQVNGFLETLLGKEVWDGTKTNWKKANRIIATGTSIVWTVRSLYDSMRDISEWTASNLGKLMNSAKRSKVVGEKDYPWQSENVKAQGRFARAVDKYREKIEGLDDAASSLSGVTGNVLSVQDEFKELGEQKDEFAKSLKDAVSPPADPSNPNPGENKAVADAAAKQAKASAAPEIPETALKGAE